jgi:23S rRNA pseudouridine2605 synthase
MERSPEGGESPLPDDSSPARPPEERAAPEAVAEAPRTERLHKYLASTGAGSRRECETFIEQGRVSVNGKVVAKQGVKVDPQKDVVLLDGERVKAEAKVYYLLHKPPGYISTSSDEMGRPRVVDLVRDDAHRIYTVGRLDADSTGLILLTNDGAIANVVCHPRYRIEKTYQVVVRGEVTREQVARIEAGVWLAEGKSSPARVRLVGRNPRRDETMVEITLFEGRNREVRRAFASVGLHVRRLTRTRIGPLEIGELPPGRHVRLPEAALAFVHEAEALYLANKEAWDAEIADRPRPPRGFRPGGALRGPRRPGAGGPPGKGPRGPFRGRRPEGAGAGGAGRPFSGGGGPRRFGSDGPRRPGGGGGRAGPRRFQGGPGPGPGGGGGGPRRFGGGGPGGPRRFEGGGGPRRPGSGGPPRGGGYRGGGGPGGPGGGRRPEAP